MVKNKAVDLPQIKTRHLLRSLPFSLITNPNWLW